MSEEKKKTKPFILYSVLSLSLVAICSMSYTIKVHAAIGKLSVAEVRSLVKEKDFSKGFPLDVNKRVVKWVNKFARTKKGIKYTRKALSNYYGHKDAILKHIKDYGHPKELAAIPFVESLYQNLPQASEERPSAGMWQFIPSTGRAYNLHVSRRFEDRTDEFNDERLNVTKETDAAMRYLGALHLRFQDWRLAMLSYNAGERAVQDVIDSTGSRDVWKITKSGLRYDKGYLAKVMAAMIIIKYPEIVH